MDSDIFILLLVVSFCFGFLFYMATSTVGNYINSENYCETIGMEMVGWRPDGASLTCQGLEAGFIVEKQFKQVNGEYYPVKEGGC